LETFYPKSEEDKLLVMKQLTSALNYLHSKQILHLDICSRNILSRRIRDYFHVSLCDFSLSCVSTSDEIISVCPKITTDHRPYENLRGSKRYSKKSDVWSLGIVFYRLIHDKHLFKLCNVPSENPISFDYELATRFEIEQLQSWGEWPSSSNEFIIKMLELDVKKRIDTNILCDMFELQKFPEKLLKHGPMTLKSKWVYVSKYFKKIDTTCLKQVELLYLLVINEMEKINIYIDDDERNNYFLSCYAIIKSSMNMISGINIHNASMLYNRVYEIFQLTKGKILSYED
jgi:serine/threonine protein kinase